MTLPSVSISKNAFTTSQAPASTAGILAIIAASSVGTANVPGGYSRTDSIVTAFGYGPLVDYAAYDINTANEPCVLCKATTSYAGAMGSITPTLLGGTSVITDNASTPYDTYNVIVTFVAGGTRGVAGITYTYTVDGGVTTSGVTALGTAVTLTIPNTGVSFALAAGTVIAGATVAVRTTRPMMNDSDITTAMTALSRTRLPFEGVLLDCSAGAGTVGVIDTILSGWEGNGVFKFALINSRYKNEPAPATEDEATFAAALTTAFGSQTSIRMCVGADGAHSTSPITGYNLKRPTAMFLAARAMQIQIGEDPAFVGRGAVSNCQVADPNGNPRDHDEDLFPNLDSLRLTTLRSFAPGGPEGIYICNANTIAPSGSTFAYLQHIRTMNRACEIAWAELTRQLSRGFRKNLKPDPVTGVVTIFEADAAGIDALVNDALTQSMSGQVNAFKFTLSRTDDVTAIPCIVTGVVSLQSLVYIKGFRVQAQFVKTITTAV